MYGLSVTVIYASSECGHDRQMVAEAALVAKAVVDAMWATGTTPTVVGEQEVRSKDTCRCDAFGQQGTDEHLIQLHPCAAVIMTACEACPVRIGEEVREAEMTCAAVGHEVDAAICGRIVEVAHDDQLWAATRTTERIAEPTYTSRSIYPIRFGCLPTVATRGEMADDDVERIPRGDASPSVKQVARPFRTISKGDAHGAPTEQSESVLTIEQRIVDATRIIAAGDATAIALATQLRMVHELLEDGLVLHLTQSNEGR